MTFIKLYTKYMSNFFSLRSRKRPLIKTTQTHDNGLRSQRLRRHAIFKLYDGMSSRKRKSSRNRICLFIWVPQNLLSKIIMVENLTYFFRLNLTLISAKSVILS